MKDILLKHYEQSKAKGLITHRTKVPQFVDKIEEGWLEINNCYADDLIDNRIPSDEFFHECSDLLLTITDMLIHYKVDIRDELNKNIRVQKP